MIYAHCTQYITVFPHKNPYFYINGNGAVKLRSSPLSRFQPRGRDFRCSAVAIELSSIVPSHHPRPRSAPTQKEPPMAPILTRRTVLRGIGAAVALPWLEAMGPVVSWADAKEAKAAPAPNRMAFLYVPNGK